MHLNSKDKDHLLLHYIGVLAKDRKERGLKLNYVESIAYISMNVMEAAREGNKTVADLMQEGRNYLNEEDVMPGVASMIADVQIEATFPDGQKLVTIHDPIV